MLDNERAVMGDNNPPPFDPEVRDNLSAKAQEFIDASNHWKKAGEVTTEHQAGQLTDQIDGLRGLYKKVDTARKEAKQPHDAAGKAVQDAFNPILTKLKRAADALKPMLADYATKKAEAEAEAKRKAEEEARKKAEEAAAALKAAEESGDIGAQVDAEEAAKAAEEAAKKASEPTKTNVKSATGAGRTMALRTQKEVEVTNVRVLFMHFHEHPDVLAVLSRLATAAVRAKGYDHEAAPIPGIKITERKVMA